MQQLNRLLTPPDDLLQWKDMPQHLQFNPYVLTGYRPLQGVKGCLSSLFYVHNETINILTHVKLHCLYLIFAIFVPVGRVALDLPNPKLATNRSVVATLAASGAYSLRGRALSLPVG
ncbi:hypothetical protein pipiens_000987, partial [Culex pipiens pipiens]